MTHRFAALLATASIVLAGCATTDNGGTVTGMNIFNLTSGYDSRLQGHAEDALGADTPEALQAAVDAMAALAEDANGKADAAADDSDARLVWLSIAANAYDMAAMMTPAGADAISAYRTEVLSATSALQEACGEGTADPRLGYRCAAGTMVQVLNGSETALADFEAAVSSDDAEAAKASAESYGVAVTQDWPIYQDAISAFPLGDQDLTPISERQIANACAFNAAAQSGSPTWLNTMRTRAQTGDNSAVFARNGYIYAAADVASVLAIEPAGSACASDGDERSPACAGQLERGLTFFCNAQSAR
ncbi:MAG: hypothetical protein AAFX86_01295 [Pseudomonadota bacterium]